MAHLISGVLSAINAGYPAHVILQEISKKYAKFAQPINKALAAGFTAQSILHRFVDRKGTTSQDEYFTEHEQTEKRRRQEDLLKKSALIGGVGALSSVASGALGLGNSSQESGFPKPQSQGQAELFEKFNKLPEQSETRTVKDVVGLGTSSLEKAYPQLSKFAEKMFSSGKTANEIYAMLRRSKLYNPLIKKYEEREKKSYLDVLEEFESQQQRQSLGNKEALKQSMAELLKLIGG